MAGEDTKKVVARAFHAAADDYERVGPVFFSLFGETLVRKARLGTGMRVLDVGCGTGAALVPAAVSVGPTGHVLGIDLAPGMIRRVRESIAARGWTHVVAQLADAEDPPLPDHDRDRILAGHVLFFLPDPGSALNRYRGILRPGGTLAFSTWGPVASEWRPVYQALFGQIPQDRLPRLTPSGDLFESEEKISALLEATGFADVEHHMVSHEIVYPSAGHWLDWTRSHGARAYWDAIPPDQHSAARTAAAAALEPLLEPNGELRVSTPVRYTLAHRL